MTTKTIYTILGAMNAFVLRLAGMDHCSFIQTLSQLPDRSERWQSPHLFSSAMSLVDFGHQFNRGIQARLDEPDAARSHLEQ